MVHPASLLDGGSAARYHLEHVGSHRSHCNLSLRMVRSHIENVTLKVEQLSGFFPFAQVTRPGGPVSQLWFDPLHRRILPRRLHPEQKPQRGDADVHVSILSPPFVVI